MCTRKYSYVLVFYSYVTRMYARVTRMYSCGVLVTIRANRVTPHGQCAWYIGLECNHEVCDEVYIFG